MRHVQDQRHGRAAVGSSAPGRRSGVGGAARGHRGRRRARRDLRARRPRRRVGLGVVAPGDRRAARVGRPRAGGLRLAEGHARAAEAPPGGHLGRRAAEPPAPRASARSCSSGRCSAAPRSRRAVRRLPPGRDGHRRGRSAARPRGRGDEGGLCGRCGTSWSWLDPSPCPCRPSRPRPASSSCRGAPSSTRRRASPTSRPSRTTGAASRARAEEWAQWYTGHRSFRPDLSVLAVDSASGEVAALVLTRRLPAGLGARAGRGVDQHGRHPAGLARQGGGAVADDRRPPAHRRRRRRLRARHPRRRCREPHRRPRACTAASASRGRPLGAPRSTCAAVARALSRPSRACGGRCRA